MQRQNCGGFLITRLLRAKSDKPHVQLLKSVVTSSISFALDFSILTISVEVLGLHYLLGGILGFITGTTLSYILSVTWVFPYKTIKNKRMEYGLFTGIGLFGLLLNILFLWFFTDIAEIHYLISRPIGAFIVFFISFFLRKKFLFSKKRKEKVPAPPHSSI